MGCCRFIYNLGLETKMAAWTSARKNVSCFDLMKQLTELKKTEAPWLNECPRQSLESAITNLESAYTNFFKGGGFPKFKKRGERQSIIFRRDSSIKEGYIRLTKIGKIKIIQHREIPDGEIRSVTLSKTPADSWFVSVLVDNKLPAPDKKPIKENTSIGIDLGLKSFLTLSDGIKYEAPKILYKQLNRLRIEQRTLARRYDKTKPIYMQSKGWQKQKLIVAKIHEKIQNQRQHFLHTTSAEIIKKYDTICIEDLNISGMVKNKKLSQSILDASWAQFLKFLDYKAEWNGKIIKKIGRFEPSSKLCSSCGHYFKELKLSDREWDCEKCGVRHDRDLNAAINIKTFGLKIKA